MIDAWLSQIAEIIGNNMWLAPLLALLAGVLTSVTPCSLSRVPLIVGYVGGVGEKKTKKAFAYSAVFSVGTAVTFVTLGIIATSAGKLMGTSSPVWYMILGALMVLMALQTWEIFNFIPSTNLLSKSRKRGFIGAFIYSVSYNGSYMLPELILTLVVTAFLLSSKQIEKLLEKEN